MESPSPTEAGESAIDDDPLGRLPEHILHTILSLLPSRKERARTAVISRSWRRAWSSYPLFDFDLQDFRPGEPETLDEKHLHNERFINSVDRSMSRLRQQRIKLPRLKLRAGIVETERLPSLCDKWIGMALDDGAQELNLNIYTENRLLDWPYPVPARVFSSDFLRSLTIASASLIAPLDGITAVNLNSLRSLDLDGARVDDQGLQKLLEGCPLLENLELRHCEPLRRITIRGLNFLRTVGVKFCGFPGVEVEAPSLEKFDYRTYNCWDSDTAVVLDIGQQLKHLNLHSTIDDGRFQELLARLPLLESLTIDYCQVLRRIRISNPLLKKFEVATCWDLEDIEIDAPILSSFVYRGVLGKIPIIRMGNPASLSNCEAEFSVNWLPLRDDWFLRLREFLIQTRTRSLSFIMNQTLVSLDQVVLLKVKRNQRVLLSSRGCFQLAVQQLYGSSRTLPTAVSWWRYASSSRTEQKMLHVAALFVGSAGCTN